MVRRSGEEPWAARVDRVTTHIRTNLDGDLRVETLARVAHASPFHFHRIFAAITGEPPGALVRRARTERAAHLIAASPDRRLGDIAVQVGFTELSDLSRAFRSHYGRSPTEWRRTRPPPLAAPTPAEVVDRSADTTIRELPQLRLLTIRVPGIIGIDDLRPGYFELLDTARSLGINPDHQQLVGMAWDHHETTDPELITYDFGLTIPDGIHAPHGLSIRNLPATPVVAVTCRGSIRSVAEAWDYLYHRWFPPRTAQPADLPAFKWFHRRPDQLSWSSWDLDCMIATRP